MYQGVQLPLCLICGLYSQVIAFWTSTTCGYWLFFEGLMLYLLRVHCLVNNVCWYNAENVVKYIQDIQKHRQGFPSSLKLSNGYILPEGKMTPNTLFVGGIDMKVMTFTINRGFDCFCGLIYRSNWCSTIVNSAFMYCPNWYLFFQVDENEIREFFAKYGSVKEVKIITYRGGICKGWVNR